MILAAGGFANGSLGFMIPHFGDDNTAFAGRGIKAEDGKRRTEGLFFSMDKAILVLLLYLEFLG